MTKHKWLLEHGYREVRKKTEYYSYYQKGEHDQCMPRESLFPIIIILKDHASSNEGLPTCFIDCDVSSFINYEEFDQMAETIKVAKSDFEQMLQECKD
jgi:hypothetical protein